MSTRVKTDVFQRQLDNIKGCEIIYASLTDAVSHITVPEHYPKFREDTLNKLCNNIKRLGIIQPIIVKRSNGSLTLIDGWKRLQCAMQNQIRTIPLMVCEDIAPNLGDAVTLTLNIIRSKPCGWEIIHAIHTLRENGTKWNQIEASIGLKPKTLKNYETAMNNFLSKVIANADESQVNEVYSLLREQCVTVNRFMACSNTATDPQSFIECIKGLPRTSIPYEEAKAEAKVKQMLRQITRNNETSMDDVQLALELYSTLMNASTIQEACERFRQWLTKHGVS